MTSAESKFVTTRKSDVSDHTYANKWNVKQSSAVLESFRSPLPRYCLYSKMSMLYNVLTPHSLTVTRSSDPFHFWSREVLGELRSRPNGLFALGCEVLPDRHELYAAISGQRDFHVIRRNIIVESPGNTPSKINTSNTAVSWQAFV